MKSDSRNPAMAARPWRHAVRFALLAALAVAPLRASSQAAAPAPRLQEEQMKAAEELQTLARLPAARLGEPYRRRVIFGGTAAYTIDPISIAPAGMGVTPQGFLEGKPTRLGANVLMLIARDSAQPAHVTRGLFALTVLPAAPVAAPPERRPAPPPPPPAPWPPTPAGQIELWSLSQGDLVTLGAPPPPPPPPPAADPPPPPAANAADPRPPALGERSPPAIDTTPSSPPFLLSPAEQDRLKVIVNLEYPTLALFRAAVRARLDPPPPGRATPDAEVELIARQAFKPQDLARAPRAVLKDDSHCGCLPPAPRGYQRTTYGFFPFWRPSHGDQAVDFSLFDRVEVLGAQIEGTSWLRPGSRTASDNDWAQDMNVLAGNAHAHGSRLDLILQGSNWGFLPRSDAALQTMAASSAAEALKLARQPKLKGIEPTFRGLLLNSIWKTRPNRVFDGVTVMFTPPQAGSADSVAFDRFFDLFVMELVKQINARHEPFGLNIVAPYEPKAGGQETLFRPGAYNWENVLKYLHQQTPDPNLYLPKSERDNYPAASDVQVRLLAFLPSPTSAAKKALIAEINDTENYQTGRYKIQGYGRVLLTNWLVPILFDPAGAPPTPSGAPSPGVNPAFVDHAGQTGRPGEADDMEMDLLFSEENYGGAGVWPIPISGLDAGAFVDQKISTAFFADRKIPIVDSGVLKVLPICSTFLRLTWQVLVLLIPFGLLFAHFANLSQAHRRTVLWGTALCAAFAALLGFFLLEVDPALDLVKVGNGPFLATLLILIGWGIVSFTRPQIRRP